MNERPIPEAALEDENSVEMLRVWIAKKKLHCSIRVGMYKESSEIPEEKAWGTILADVARHLASALESGYSINHAEAIAEIRRSFEDELDRPTSDMKGSFVERH